MFWKAGCKVGNVQNTDIDVPTMEIEFLCVNSDVSIATTILVAYWQSKSYRCHGDGI